LTRYRPEKKSARSYGRNRSGCSAAGASFLMISAGHKKKLAKLPASQVYSSMTFDERLSAICAVQVFLSHAYEDQWTQD
jgi:hypothetical protein